MMFIFQMWGKFGLLETAAVAVKGSDLYFWFCRSLKNQQTSHLKAFKKKKMIMTHVFSKQADINLDHSEKYSHFALCMFFPTNYHKKQKHKGRKGCVNSMEQKILIKSNQLYFSFGVDRKLYIENVQLVRAAVCFFAEELAGH